MTNIVAIAIITFGTNVTLQEIRHPSGFNPATDRMIETTTVVATNIVPVHFEGREIQTTNVVGLATNVVVWQWQPTGRIPRRPLNMRDRPIPPLPSTNRVFRAPKQLPK